MTNAKALIALGVIAVLALAGAGIVMDDADAAAPAPVQYVVGTVTYSSDAGISEDGLTVTLPAIEAIGASVPAGKEFKGWNATSATEATYLAAGTTTAYAPTFWAVLTDITYTVTFDKADGSAVAAQTGTAADKFTVPADPSKEGFIFAYWAIGGADAELEAGAEVPFTADAAYVAAWTVDHAVSFSVDGTTISTGTVSSYAVPSAPSKTGYEFAGWSCGGTTYAAADVPACIEGADADLAFVAVWTPLTYTVTFEADGAVVLTETVQYNARAVEPATVPVKEGFDFQGWSADGTAVYDFGTPVLGDLTLTALFTETPAPAVVVYVVDTTTYTAAPEAVAKEGYEFAGWSDGTSVIASEALPAYIAGLAPGTSVTLIAQWTPLVYTVEFVSDGAVVLTQSVKHGELATMPATVPVKEGFDFQGWDYDFSKPVLKDTTINAIYTETPAPEKTGLDNPMTAIAAILGGVVVLFILGIAVWKKDVIRSKVNARLLKAASKEGEEKP